MEDDRSVRRPRISDYQCSERVLRSVDFSVLKPLESDEKRMNDLTALFTLTEEQLNDFATQPLKGLGFDQFVKQANENQQPVRFEMPFNVSSHADAKAPVCTEMIERLEQDLKLYEGQVNSKRPKTLTVDMLDEVTVPLAHKLELLDRLEATCLAQREKDLIWVQTAFNTLQRWCNYVTFDTKELDDVKGFEGLAGAYHYVLSRVSSTEAFLAIEFVIALLTCSQADTDMQQVNPFVNSAQTQELLVLTSLALVHANRLGHVNRVLSASRKVRKMVTELHSLAPNSRSVADLKQRLKQKVEGISENLIASRYYMTADRKFDPRYLVFEFIWNIMLREAQVEMIDEFMKVVICHICLRIYI